MGDIKKYTDAERLIILEKIQVGMNKRAIAVFLGRTEASIFNEIKMGGGLANYNPNWIKEKENSKDLKCVICMDQRIEIKKLLDCGTSIQEISRLIKISYFRIREEVLRGGGVGNYQIEVADTNYKKTIKSRLDGLRNYNSLSKRIDFLEEQVNILCETIRELMNVKDD